MLIGKTVCRTGLDGQIPMESAAPPVYHWAETKKKHTTGISLFENVRFQVLTRVFLGCSTAKFHWNGPTFRVYCLHHQGNETSVHLNMTAVLQPRRLNFIFPLKWLKECLIFENLFPLKWLEESLISENLFPLKWLKECLKRSWIITITRKRHFLHFLAKPLWSIWMRTVSRIFLEDPHFKDTSKDIK
jgi:hypothetical protein